ncbi:hypothetical protein DFH08DRAFT_1028650 [Mycena albidolilacea]|uniref:Uncharacterized protein n=1 Tax=Mycena albidolilacea TaxID=1033008 RepID=A0AAD6ZIC4_9AGAR|nr:hypothetical protein DFH08DRAFT_1028650 [Mycena albidolilacea]
MLVPLRAKSESLDPRIYPRLILGLLVPGLVLTTALLALFGYAAWNIVSRRYLDRVSFRLLAYTLVVHLIFGVSLAMSILGGYSDWQCSLLYFTTNLSYMFISCIFFCMALNVPLVVVYKISGQAMEKYYVAGTTLICLICNVPPYASGNLGHIGPGQSDLLVQQRGPEGSLSLARGHTDLLFRNIILRIGLYPLVSCLLSVTAGGVDLYESRKYKMKAFESKLDDELLLVAMAGCAGRPLIYGLLAATDPSFIRALYALRHPDAETETQFCRPSGCLSTIVEIPPHVISFDDAETLDNDHARPECIRGRESSITPRRDLEGGKKRRSYFGRGTSGATTRLSVDVVPYHI